MTRFNVHERLSVVPPYRLDLTADALRRLAANVVDIVTPDGAYCRALSDERGVACAVVRQLDEDSLDVRITGRDGARFLPVLERMLGMRVDLAEWRRRAALTPWLSRLALTLDGVKPPRYATLWEACANAVVFQQISIHAAAAILRRVVEAIGEETVLDDWRARTFPSAQRLLDTPDVVLGTAGLSVNKRVALRAIAEAIVGGVLHEAEIDALPTPRAAERLVNVRGIGPWSAAVILLRGFGRLDTFPLRDSGVARSVKLLAGDDPSDIETVLERLGPTRGMLYYHLLLGRIRNLVPVARD